MDKVHLEDISFPPSQEQLDYFEPSDASALPSKYRRSVEDRVFVNRTVHLEKIEYVGFDMDYTLAVYKEPEFEELVYTLVLQKLLRKGYPEAISTLHYDPSFSQRGLFLDIRKGNLIKVDMFGNILTVVHGHTVLDKSSTRAVYPDMTIHSEEIGRRFYLFNTLFELPEMCLFADLVHVLEKNTHFNDDNVDAELDLSYENLFTDLRNAVDETHHDNSLKTTVVNNFPKYMSKDPRMPILLERLREHGKKVFVMTNSDYSYTKEVMAYLLNGTSEKNPDWKDFFDIIIVSAKKPRFFEEGSTLREVDLTTGSLKLSKINAFEKGKVYSGGNLATFRKLTGTKGSEVMYIGDNIYHDIIRSKKSRCNWKTLLVLRELTNEITQWKTGSEAYNRLLNLEYIRAETFRGLNSTADAPPKIDALRDSIEKCVEAMDAVFNPFFGSIFRNGSRQSFFSQQVGRYADLYASDYLNLLNYPLFYYFSPDNKLLPHEEEAFSEHTKHY